jgi:FMN-dependent NADH-azoreductase
MPTLLNIQYSPRGGNSISRTLSQDFVTAWQTKHPDGKVVLRDLAENSLPYVGIPWITGIFLPADKHTPEMQRALAVSDELIAELLAADEILIGTPMYNFTVPANLKAWIDLIVRPRVTHSGPPERKGLVIGKTCKIIIASGGTYDEACLLPHPTMNLATSNASSPLSASPRSKSFSPAARPRSHSVQPPSKNSLRSFVLPSLQPPAGPRNTRKATLSAPESVARKPAH